MTQVVFSISNINGLNNLVANTGAIVMKLVEMKELFTYIFTEIIPMFDKSQSQDSAIDNKSFFAQEGFWIGVHLTGSIAFSFTMPELFLTGSDTKLIGAISATSSYAARHYYHTEFKHNVFGSEIANSCLYNIAMDAGFGALTSLPVAVMTGSPILMLYGAAQGAAIAALPCISSSNEASWTGYMAGNVAVAAVLYQGASHIGATNNFNGAMVAINKIASLLTSIALVHKVISKVTDNLIETLYSYYPYMSASSNSNNKPSDENAVNGESSSWWWEEIV